MSVFIYKKQSFNLTITPLKILPPHKSLIVNDIKI